MKNTYATFADPKMAEKAGGALLDHGIKAEHITIVMPEGYRSENDSKHEEEHKENLEHVAKSGITTTTMADSHIGSAKGAGVGIVTGTLAALAAVFIPGAGLVLGGGALAIAIAGVAGTTVAGAVAGGVMGYLKDQGVPDDAIAHYHETLKNGGAMITVSPTDEKIDNTTIESILAKYEGTVTTYPMAQPQMAVTK